jgi:hypothetical protein
MKKKLLALALLTGGSMFAQTRFSVGVNVGGYGQGNYAPAAPSYGYAAAVPPCPGPDYSWTDGYWSGYGGQRSWVNGYWARQQRFDNRRYDDRSYGRDRDDRFYRHERYEREWRDRDRDRDDRRFGGYENGFRRR